MEKLDKEAMIDIYLCVLEEGWKISVNDDALCIKSPQTGKVYSFSEGFWKYADMDPLWRG